jgi:hypothetical protein
MARPGIGIAAPASRWVRPLLSIALCVTASAAAAVGPGDPAPDFALFDVNGNTVQLSNYRGRVVLLALIGYG